MISKCALFWTILPLALAVAPELQVNLTNGSPLLGIYKTSLSGRGIRSFLNIPFAEPPLGKLRFADPVPKAPWSKPLGLSEEVIICPQFDFLFAKKKLGTEDCLVLQVHAPLNPQSTEALPVILYLHGGGFSGGSGTVAVYSPEYFLDEDVILVTANYRIGALGFMSTFSKEFSGNYGLKDQVLALKWIQENIEVFGGNPKRVTLFGESAGSCSLGKHLQSPMSRGLFQKAIMHSGTGFDLWSNVSREVSLNYADKLLTVMDCKDPNGDVGYATALECMRQKEALDIIGNMTKLTVLSYHPLIIFTPVLESPDFSKNPFITEADLNNVRGGSDIPLMIGVTSHEGGVVTTMLADEPNTMAELESNFEKYMGHLMYLNGVFDNATLHEKMKIIRQFYFKGQLFEWKTHHEELTKIFSDFMFMIGLSRTLKRRVKTADTADTFVFNFNYRGSTSFSDLLAPNSDIEFGVCHGDELFYIFPFVKNVILSSVMTPQDQEMRAKMIKMWTNFAKFGNPSTEQIKWTPIKNRFPIDYLRIGHNHLYTGDPKTKTDCEMERGLYEKDFEFLDEFFKEQVCTIWYLMD